jgi:hypothetical protein
MRYLGSVALGRSVRRTRATPFGELSRYESVSPATPRNAVRKEKPRPDDASRRSLGRPTPRARATPPLPAGPPGPFRFLTGPRAFVRPEPCKRRPTPRTTPTDDLDSNPIRSAPHPALARDREQRSGGRPSTASRLARYGSDEQSRAVDDLRQKLSAAVNGSVRFPFNDFKFF